MTKGKLLYEGKAKRLYEIEGKPELVWQEFKDSLTAFNAQKLGSFPGKGVVNREISALIFKYLGSHGVLHHWIENRSQDVMITKKLSMLKLEVVVRNRLAGSTAKKFGKPEGEVLATPLVEFYLKEDALADPFMSDDQALMLGVVKNSAEIDEIKSLARKVNSNLITFFKKAGLDLVDFKIELGRTVKGELLLADEISPDTCRLWDEKTQEKMDKDRFRRDLGKVQESYEEVCSRLKNSWGEI